MKSQVDQGLHNSAVFQTSFSRTRKQTMTKNTAAAASVNAASSRQIIKKRSTNMFGVNQQNNPPATQNILKEKAKFMNLNASTHSMLTH